jgi:hypothetical protein
MKKVNVMVIFGILFLSLTSCVSMMENMRCDGEQIDPDNCEKYEVRLGEKCE